MAKIVSKPTRVVGYVRVSSQQQADEGYSLDTQRGQLAAYAALYGLDVVAIEEDAGLSASTLDRPGLARALAILASGKADGLLVAKLDRLTRSVMDLGQLVSGIFQKSALVSVAEQIDTRSASGRLVLNVLASVSQWEREAIGERTKVVLAAKRARGERVSRHLPYGSRLAADGVRLESEPIEQETLARAKALRAKGLSLTAVSIQLAEAGRMNRAGKPFGVAALHAMTTPQ